MTQIDRINLNILSILQKEGRIANQHLADKVHLSPSACLERVKKLEKQGLIKRYRADISLESLASSIKVFATVALHDHRRARFDAFEAAVRAIPEVVDCVKVSGNFDYILCFVCRDIHQYHALSDELLEIGAGSMELASHVVLDNTKSFTGYPLERLCKVD